MYTKDSGDRMECYSCGYDMDGAAREYECPYCGEDDYGEGFYVCENCGALNTWSGDEWECENCQNRTTGMAYTGPDFDICPNCGGMIADDGYCEDCGENEDVNQGWLGENY
jgi:predicted RNA-binding Zn-ribbon protein involved in translation (DUF1610 family)